MKTAQQLRMLATVTVRIGDFSTPVSLRVAKGEAVAITEADLIMGWVDIEPGAWEVDVPSLIASDKIPSFPMFVSSIPRRYLVSIPQRAVAGADYIPVEKSARA